MFEKSKKMGIEKNKQEMQNKCDTVGADEVIEGSNDDFRHLIQVKWPEVGFS